MVVNRRTLLLRAGALGAGAVGTPLLLAAGAAGQGDESTVLARSLGLERTLQTIYGAALRSGEPGGGSRQPFERLLRDARAHERLLREASGGLAGPPKRPRARDVAGLGGLGGARAYSRFALNFETQAYLSYLDAMGTLSTPAALSTAAELGGSCAGHMALLRLELGRDPAPEAFETGAPS